MRNRSTATTAALVLLLGMALAGAVQGCSTRGSSSGSPVESSKAVVFPLECATWNPFPNESVVSIVSGASHLCALTSLGTVRCTNGAAPADAMLRRLWSAEGGRTCGETTTGELLCWGGWVETLRSASVEESPQTLLVKAYREPRSEKSAVDEYVLQSIVGRCAVALRRPFSFEMRLEARAGAIEVDDVTSRASFHRCLEGAYRSAASKIRPGTLRVRVEGWDAAQVRAGPFKDVRSVAVAGSGECVVASDGVVWCAGLSRAMTGLGDEVSWTGRDFYTRIPLPEAKQVSAGLRHVCVTTIDDGVRCWGWAARGWMGGPEVTTSPRAVALAPGVVTGVWSHQYASCFATGGREVQCLGQLPAAVDPTHAASWVERGTDIREVSWGAEHLCVLDGERLRCRGGYGDCSMPEELSRRRLLQTVSGERQTCVLTVAGEVVCWGAPWPDR